MSRQSLENMAVNVLNMRYFPLENILGERTGVLMTTASSLLVQKVINNLSSIQGQAPTNEQIVDELVHRDFYARIIILDSTIRIMSV